MIWKLRYPRLFCIVFEQSRVQAMQKQFSKIISFCSFEDYVFVQQPKFLAMCLCQTVLYISSSLLVFKGGEWCWWVLPYTWEGPSTRRLPARTHARKSLQVRTEYNMGQLIHRIIIISIFALFFVVLSFKMIRTREWNRKKNLHTLNWLTGAGNRSYIRLEHLFWKRNRINRIKRYNSSCIVCWQYGLRAQ